MTSDSSRGKRPFGVYAIIALSLLRVSLVALDMAAVRLGRPTTYLPQPDDPLTLYVAGAVIILAMLVICLGLFRLQRWAWIATMILIGLNLLVAIFDYLNGQDTSGAMLLDVISVFYLNQRYVQAAFESRQMPPEVTA
jgi:lysylphosphatidylglycerol synthetase-like protein (DUF2156 family)